jgi:hypothetical protein
MSNKKSDGAYKITSQYVVISLTAVILIFSGNHVYKSHHLIGTAIVEMGVALLIAVIVILTIERSQRKHQDSFIETYMQKISKQLFNAAYSKLIPDVVLNEFIECLSKADIIRRDHEIHYSISPCQDKQGYVICKAVSSYTFENITAEDIDQKITMFLEKPLDPNLFDLCKVLSLTVNDKAYDHKEIESKTTANEENFLFESIERIPRSGSIKVIAKAQLIKQIDDSENWELKHPSDGIRITLKCDPSLKLKLHARSRHSNALKEKLSEDYEKTWELKHGILPHQSIAIWWSKKR